MLPQSPKTAFIAATLTIVFLGSSSPTVLAGDWPQWRGPNRDGVWDETGLVEEFPDSKIEIRWTSPVGSGFSGPTVADGRVYVTDRLTKPKEVERVHCFDWETGKNLWTHTYDCAYQVDYPLGPRASVSIDEERVYALGTMGHFRCLHAANGEVIFEKDLGAEYEIRLPIWGIAASPLVYGDSVILQIGGSNGACLVSLDKRTGNEKWRALDDPASYSAPIIIEQASREVLVCVSGNHVSGLNPGTGEVYWRHPFKPRQMVMHVPTPVVYEDRLFLTSFFDGSLMLRLLQDTPAVEKLWRRRGINERRTDALHSTIGTPYFTGDRIYGIGSYGELRCLDAATGDRIWEDQTLVPRARWATIHMVRNGERMFIFNEVGELLIGELSPKGFKEISRAKLIQPTTEMSGRTDGVCWAHPAFAYGHVFARNDRELVCASLRADDYR